MIAFGTKKQLNFKRRALNLNFMALFLLIAICSLAPRLQASSSVASSSVASPRPVVVVSVEPLALLVREICDILCEVVTLVPRGISEHDWHPNPKEMAKAKNAVASIAVGLEFDNAWFVKIGTDSKSILWLGPILNPMTWWSDDLSGNVKHDRDEVGHKHKSKRDEADHKHGKLDPHFWVDADRMAIAATAVAVHLSHVAPASSEAFQGRGKAISSRLTSLQLVVESRRKTWNSRPVVMFHDVAGYFGRRFNLPILSVASGSAGHDLSARMIADMSKRFLSANVAAVVVERDGGAAKNLARELKTSTKVIDFAAAKNYVNWDAWYLQVVSSWEDVLKK